MRRPIAIGAIALLVLVLAVPLTSGGTTPVVKHVDDSVVVQNGDQMWFAKLEARTNASGALVQFGYMDLYGIEDSSVAGQIHEFSISRVDYSKTASGAQSALLTMRECRFVWWSDPEKVPDQQTQPQCTDASYPVTDGSAVGQGDTFQNDWVIKSGEISIYSTGGQNGQQRPAPAPRPSPRSRHRHGEARRSAEGGATGAIRL